MKIGVLTGGGDCPGLNAAIRAIVKYGSKRYEDSFLGVKYGWKGLVNKSMPIEERVMQLTPCLCFWDSHEGRHHSLFFAD